MIRNHNQEDVSTGKFDPITMTESGEMEIDTADGKQSIATRERSYVPNELSLLFKLAGFNVEGIYGGTAGNWSKRLLDLDEFEIMVIGTKESVDYPQAC